MSILCLDVLFCGMTCVFIFVVCMRVHVAVCYNIMWRVASLVVCIPSYFCVSGVDPLCLI